jgi:general secretion pathway protein H
MRTFQARKNEAGFTLVELVVVLALFGMLSAAVMLAMRDPAAGLKSEAERFAAYARAAEQRAVIEGRALTLHVTRAGFTAEREGRSLGQDQGWKSGVRASDGELRIKFDPTGIADAAEVHLARGERRAAVRIGADGRVDVEP